VGRAEKALKEAGLIKKNRDAWEVTDRGKKEITQMKPQGRNRCSSSGD